MNIYKINEIYVAMKRLEEMILQIVATHTKTPFIFTKDVVNMPKTNVPKVLQHT